MKENKLRLLLVALGLILPLIACELRPTAVAPTPVEATPTPKPVEASPTPILVLPTPTSTPPKPLEASPTPAVVAPTPTLTPPKPTPTPAAAVPGVPPIFQAMASAMANVKTYRTKMVTEGFEIFTEYVLPDKMHTKSKVMGMEMETIVIGGITYTKIGDGAWEKMEAALTPLPGAPEIEVPDFTEMAEEIMATIEVKEIGVEMVEGVKCGVYEIRFGEEAEPMRYYIGVTDNLPRKIEVGEMEIIFHDYNAPIEIKPPI